MSTIWKCDLTQSVNRLQVPQGAEFLCAREQGNKICVWFKCDPDQTPKERKLIVLPTGGEGPLENVSRYIGTASLSGGTLIFHVFEVL